MSVYPRTIATEPKKFQIADLWLSVLMIIAMILPGVYMGVGYPVFEAAMVSLDVGGVLISVAAWICCVVFIIMRVVELIRKRYHRRQFFFIARIVFALIFIYACYDVYKTFEGVVNPLFSLSRLGRSIDSDGLNQITSMLAVKYGIGFWLTILLALANIIILWKHPNDDLETEETEETEDTASTEVTEATEDKPVEAQAVADNVVKAEAQTEQVTEEEEDESSDEDEDEDEDDTPGWKRWFKNKTHVVSAVSAIVVLVLFILFMFFGTKTSLFRKLFTNIDYDDDDIELAEESERSKNIDADLWAVEIENAIPLLGAGVDMVAEMLDVKPDANYTFIREWLTEEKIGYKNKIYVTYHTGVAPAEERSHIEKKYDGWFETEEKVIDGYFWKKGVKIESIKIQIWPEDESQDDMLGALGAALTIRGWKDQGGVGNRCTKYTSGHTTVVIGPDSQSEYPISAMISNE